MYAAIEIHRRNYRPTVWCWKPFGTCSIKLRRRFNPKTSVVNIFATFLLLGFTRLIFISLQILQPESLVDMYGNTKWRIRLSLVLWSLHFVLCRHHYFDIERCILSTYFFLIIILCVVFSIMFALFQPYKQRLFNAIDSLAFSDSSTPPVAVDADTLSIHHRRSVESSFGVRI